jgi:nucleotide-binding universal stress UspA family protein
MDAERRPSTILAATDFSQTGESGVAWAAELARAHGARIVLCHALSPLNPVAPAPEFMPVPARYYDDLHAAAAERLEETATKLRSRGLSIETTLDVGDAATVVCDQAVRVRADLVVAGTRGLTGWKNLVLGSTAAHILRRAPCPVLTVHPGDVERHRALRTVLVATDFSADAALAAEAAAHVVAPFDRARMVLLHAYRAPVVVASPLPVPIVLDDPQQVEAAAKIELDELAARLRGTIETIETKIVCASPSRAILDSARAVGADLIAMGTHGRSGMKRLVLGSTAEHVLAEAPCPVLTVHRETAPDGANGREP